MNKNPLSELLGIFNKLGFQQKMLLVGSAFVSLILFGMIILFLNDPVYTVLYNNMDEAEASKVVEELAAQKVLYKLENNGRTIKVQEDKVQDVRLALAAKGLPSTGVIGYEIFDKSQMGMSEFMQNLNYKRALEGELSRTINQQEGIEAARVHIVVPKKTLFRNEEKPTTASVVLKLNGGFQLSQTNINAILNLVSSSIEGLDRNRITLVDTRGRLLSKQSEDDPLIEASSKQYELKQSVEKYLTNKAQNILDNVLGHGNAIVEVDAELNFSQVEKTIQSFDPETQVAISEQTTKSENSGKNMVDSSGTVSQNSTINYEISKTVERVIEGTGNIKKLSVAAVINDASREAESEGMIEIIYEPRTDEQMQKLEQIVRNAVGVEDGRSDKISIVNIPFETNGYDQYSIDEQSPQQEFSLDNMEQYFNYLLVLLAIGASLLILRGLMSKLKNEKILIGTVGAGSYGGDDLYNNDFGYSGSFDSHRVSGNMDPSVPIGGSKRRNLMPVGDLEDEISDEAARRTARQEKISNYVSKNPVDAAKLINTWLHEDEI